MALERQAGGASSRWRQQRLAIAALALGFATVVVAFSVLLSGEKFFETTVDLRFVLPPAILSGALAIASLLRREGTWALPVAAVGMAAAGLVLGWVVVVGLVALGAALLIGLLSLVM